MNKGWIIVSKVEMTKVWHQDSFIPVTIVKVLPHQVVRVKTMESDGYTASVVAVPHKRKAGQYAYMTEYRLDPTMVDQATSQIGQEIISDELLTSLKLLSVTGTSKGKGFQGAVKRHNLTGNFATHGHKFTRVVGSMGNRKPRRTQKGHPHAGHLGNETVTIKSIAVISTFKKDGDNYLCLKGSVPGRRNNYLKAFFN